MSSRRRGPIPSAIPANVDFVQFTDTPLWNRPNAVWSWKHYLGDLHGSDDIPYLAAPSRCEDLNGLPPAYVTTMEFDPLRDEGILYAMAMMRDCNEMSGPARPRG